MSVCAACAHRLPGQAELCTHHSMVCDDWAATNRIMCDLIHRRKVPSRLMPEQRDDEFWAHLEAA